MLESFNKLSKASIASFEEEFFNTNKTYVHPLCVIGKNVKLGANVKVGPFCSITGNVTIKNGTKIYPNVTIGFPAQNLGTKKSLGSIEIGKNCQIREFITISAPKTDTSKTIIGDNCYIMNFSHIAHDVILENNVTLVNNVSLAGHVYVEQYATLMANSAAHQFCKIGKFSALAPYSGIRQDIPPFCLFSGAPAKFYGLNKVALQRADFSKKDLLDLKHITKMFFQDKLLLDDIKKLIQKDDNNLEQNIYVKDFIEFIEKSSRGVSRQCANDRTKA